MTFGWAPGMVLAKMIRDKKIKRWPQPAMILAVFFIVLSVSGCDALYRLLHREGAEEKELLGEGVLFEPNDRVKEVQALLKLYGYKVGRVDGLLGANTRNAVAEFQEDNGIKVSRFVDNATWAKLHMFEDFGLVVGGEVNIQAVQEALNRAGEDAGKADGKLGRRTQAAIVSFQKNQGLKPDGQIGFNTLRRLDSYLSSPAQ